MTSPSPIPTRANNLALAFQDVITVILRMRYRVQRVSDATGFRASVRKMISSAVQEVRTMGYSDELAQMALYAIIGFLDESVLNSQDPAFAEWARHPLQQQMFGSQLAGEYFFRHVSDLLSRPESPEVADALELHALCLLLGYRGKLAFGGDQEAQTIIARIRDKIQRIRGPVVLARPSAAPEVKAPRAGDVWVKWLSIAAVITAVIVLAAFLVYWGMLGSQINGIQQSSLQPACGSPTAVLVQTTIPQRLPCGASQ